MRCWCPGCNPHHCQHGRNDLARAWYHRWLGRGLHLWLPAAQSLRDWASGKAEYKYIGIIYIYIYIYIYIVSRRRLVKKTPRKGKCRRPSRYIIYMYIEKVWDEGITYMGHSYRNRELLALCVGPRHWSYQWGAGPDRHIFPCPSCSFSLPWKPSATPRRCQQLRPRRL